MSSTIRPYNPEDEDQLWYYYRGQWIDSTHPKFAEAKAATIKKYQDSKDIATVLQLAWKNKTTEQKNWERKHTDDEVRLIREHDRRVRARGSSVVPEAEFARSEASHIATLEADRRFPFHREDEYANLFIFEKSYLYPNGDVATVALWYDAKPGETPTRAEINWRFEDIDYLMCGDSVGGSGVALPNHARHIGNVKELGQAGRKLYWDTAPEDVKSALGCIQYGEIELRLSPEGREGEWL